MHENSVSASLSNIEALTKPSRKISDVHAISADIHNYQVSTCFRNLSGFYVHRITANAVIVLPTKVAPAFTLEHYAGVQATKVRISEHNTKQKTIFLLF